MNPQTTSNFKAQALDEDTLRRRAPSIFATGPMSGVSARYTFVPTARIVSGLRELDWVPVDVEEQRIRLETRRGFQKHLLRFRHSGLEPDEVVSSSLRLIEFMPRVGELVQRFRDRVLDDTESRRFAEQALLLRYPSLEEAPVEPETVLQARLPQDEGDDVWNTLNRVGENLNRGGVSDHRLDRRGRLRSVRGIRGIDSKVSLNKDLWGLAERMVTGSEAPSVSEPVVLTA